MYISAAAGPEKRYDPVKTVGKETIDYYILGRVYYARYKGVIVDIHLTFQNQIAKVQRSAAGGLRTINFVKDIPYDAALQVLNSYVPCHLDYCSRIWTGTCDS